MFLCVDDEAVKLRYSGAILQLNRPLFVASIKMSNTLIYSNKYGVLQL